MLLFIVLTLVYLYHYRAVYFCLLSLIPISFSLPPPAILFLFALPFSSSLFLFPVFLFSCFSSLILLSLSFIFHLSLISPFCPFF
ncbi:hypothetical protein XELAEV_18029903mg [Xenopus laevis]|uniref:Uncharacterized protein n=1 Tax=Xenopus laevis TaxID=8355 RepID=A0A974HI85_XENLA|nr:hypothetical protein XELAEV_18029903mg [Xenopus laevis]